VEKVAPPPLSIGGYPGGLAEDPRGNPLSDKKRAVVLLRWLVVIAGSYLLLSTTRFDPPPAVAAVVAVLLASNVVIGRLPGAIVSHPGFDLALLLFDTVTLTAGLYLTRSIGTDFYLLYFFVILLAGIGERLKWVLTGCVLAGVAYLWLGWTFTGGSAVLVAESNLGLRVFFLFSVSLCYGFLVERIWIDRERRQAEYVARLEAMNVKLRELAELKHAFVSAVSHELRTPLNAMLGYVDLVREGVVGEVRGTAWEYLDRAYRRGRHLLVLIEELLDFAKLHQSRAVAQIADTNLDALVDAVRLRAEPPARAKGLDICFELNLPSGTVRTDGQKVREILDHLVENAIKFTAEGEVRVRVAVDPMGTSNGDRSALVLEVSDTGPGIPPEARDAIFDPFRQLDCSPARQHGGMGLGLALCRGLVQLLRGEIDVESAPGRGSKFIVRLPIGSAFGQ